MTVTKVGAPGPPRPGPPALGAPGLGCGGRGDVGVEGGRWVGKVCLSCCRSRSSPSAPRTAEGSGRMSLWQ